MSYFCHRGEERLAYNVVRNTPKMIECFEKTLGVPYPYAKYSQIFLHDFGAGGMENTSATVLARRFLHDDRAHIDFSGEYVVAHELGHQWFGDLLTCRDWGQMWLNEGFATYCECLWAGETGGWEEYQRVIHGKMNQYIDEDRNQHRRPLSTNTYRGYGQVFDAHSYQKGAMVLHMLRRLLGDDTFFRALKHYLETCCGTPVVTADFVKSVEVSTGYNVDRFFDEWVYGAGYPEFTYSWSYDEASGRGTLEVEQTQNDDNDTPKVFGMPVFVTFNRVTDGEISERKWLSARFDDAGKVSESIELDFRPDFMTFDVNNEVLDVTSLANIPEGELGLLLAYEPSGIAACLDAAEELGNRKTPEAQAALLAALDRPRPWMIREAIMNALMQFEKPERVVVAAMIKAVDDADPRVRRAAFRALGECEGNEAAGKTVFEKAQFGDASCLVEAQAFEALGAFQSKDARKLLLEAIDDRDSYHDVIRVACLRSLAKYGNAEDLEMVVALTRPGKDEYLRAGACEALGILGAKLDNAGRGKALDALIDMLEDSGGVVVGGAATGLEGLNDPSVLPLLEARLKTAKGKQAKGVLKSVIAALKRDVGGEDKPSRDKPEPKPADKEEDFVLTPVE
ncbi:MAG: HEAT repeat domain-containing protein [Planctomycetaceae bacterium]|nr:HEAT repeat domain-containing protein [Planctomycetaceae bacterium]